MKSRIKTRPLLLKLILLVTCFMLVILYNHSKAATLPDVTPDNTRVAVNFKQDVKKNQLTISIKCDIEVMMQLFIFSPDGILVKEVPVSIHKKTTIPALKKGFYLYECFDNDERLQRGSLIIK